MLKLWQARLNLAAGLLFACLVLASVYMFQKNEFVRLRIASAAASLQHPFPGHGTESTNPQAANHPMPTAGVASTHVEIFSSMTADGGWFPIDFGDHASYNPNIIPHPHKNDTWFIVAQRDQSKDAHMNWFTELVCEATYRDGKMQCTKSPLILPISSTASPNCKDEFGFFNATMGPHDGRVFHGPDQPFIIYGSQSQYNCFGLWIHDFRRLVDWTPTPRTDQKFFWPTELQRPPPLAKVEKNWFAFWDNKGSMYMHYDTSNHRAFAKVNDDGSSGKDLGPLTEKNDKHCLSLYLPAANDIVQHLHQAANSLALTLCKRSDPDCTVTDDNTFILTIIQFKVFQIRGRYEPYVMLFRQSAPFEIYGISSKPFWIHGRGEPGGKWLDDDEQRRGSRLDNDQTQMLYVTSINWKKKGLNYQGFLDDELFIGFGVEDKQSAGIDVVAGDLIAELGLCKG